MTMGELVDALQAVDEYDEIMAKAPDSLSQDDLRRMLNTMIILKCFITSIDITDD